MYKIVCYINYSIALRPNLIMYKYLVWKVVAS